MLFWFVILGLPRGQVRGGRISQQMITNPGIQSKSALLRAAAGCVAIHPSFD
jgi:hypothetical protein